MKLLIVFFFIFQYSFSKAGGSSDFYISPENPFQGQNITVGIWLGYSTCDGLIVEGSGALKKNIIVEGNTIKLLTYFENLSFCPPIILIPTIPYPFGSLDLPPGDYTLELYILDEGVPFPLPAGFALNLVNSLQFQMLAPVVVDSLSIFNLLILMLLVFGIGYLYIYKSLLRN